MHRRLICRLWIVKNATSCCCVKVSTNDHRPMSQYQKLSKKVPTDHGKTYNISLWTSQLHSFTYSILLFLSLQLLCDIVSFVEGGIIVVDWRKLRRRGSDGAAPWCGFYEADGQNRSLNDDLKLMCITRSRLIGERSIVPASPFQFRCKTPNTVG